MKSAPLLRLAALWRVLCAAALLAPAAHGATAQPLVVRDDRGDEHVFAAPPQRFVTMLPSLTETVWVLGAGPRLVGVDRYSEWPPEVQRLPHLGGLEDAHIEAIAALKPDVVLASTSSRAMERLQGLGLTVVRVNSDSHADVRRTLNLVARLLGTPEEGRRVWARIESEMVAAAARVPPAWRGRSVYFEIYGGPHAAGARSFIGETLARLGMVNIAPAELGPFPKLNPEFVVRARPDVIMGAQRAQVGLGQRPGWASLDAVRRQRLCSFERAEYEMLIHPGPRMGEAASRVADCLARLEAPSSR